MEEKKIVCHDCKQELKKGSEFVRFTNEGSEELVKCRECYEADPVLKDYKECDVYSRVVGFHTPIGRWNKGKSAEWKDRKTFVVEAGSLCSSC
jgi:anaerobic ribonucleoside-triphosphate reductase